HPPGRHRPRSPGIAGRASIATLGDTRRSGAVTPWGVMPWGVTNRTDWVEDKGRSTVMKRLCTGLVYRLVAGSAWFRVPNTVAWAPGAEDQSESHRCHRGRGAHPSPSMTPPTSTANSFIVMII